MNVSKLNAATAANSAKLAPNDAHVIAARAVKDATATADGALVAALRVGVTAGAFKPEHLTAAGYAESSAKTLASEWSAGAAVAKIVGEKLALGVIADAVKASPTGTYRATLAALRAVKDRAKTAGLKTATAAQAKTLTKDAGKTAQLADAARREKLAKMRAEPRAPRVIKAADAPAVDTASPSAHWAQLAAQATQLAHAMHAAVSACPEGHDALARKLARAQADAAEVAALMVKACKA